MAVESIIIFKEGVFTITQEPSSSIGGTWGLFIVDVPSGKHYYCHANQAVQKMSDETGMAADYIIEALEHQNNYKVINHKEYIDMAEKWLKTL